MPSKSSLVLLTLIAGCTSTPPQTRPDEGSTTRDTAGDLAAEDATDSGPPDGAALANVVAVSVSGDENAYTFSVTIDSDETGCDQYADWWEVVTPSGELVYRRILAHSHVDEQPFTRSGGPVEIGAADVVRVRAHMNNAGYGGTVMELRPNGEATQVEVDPSFATSLADEDPLPSGCAF